MGKMITRVTAAVERSMAPALQESLVDYGLKNLYTITGSAPLQNLPKPWVGGLLRNPKIVQNPREVISYVVDRALAKQAFNSTVHAAGLESGNRGFVYTQSYELLENNSSCHVNSALKAPSGSEIKGQTLTGICCIVQRGEAEPISQALLESGAAPVSTYGMGAGIRDQLGLLRITIPAEKELLRVLVDNLDVEYFLAIMIKAGKLDLPGRGFVYTYPVEEAYSANVGQNANTGHAASVEQIISAVDSLYGNVEWRRRGEADQSSGYNTFPGRDLLLVCNDGCSSDLVQKAMAVGLPGATVEQWKLTNRDADSKVSPAREMATMTVGEQILNPVMADLGKQGAFGEESQGMVMVNDKVEAFTYIPKG